MGLYSHVSSQKDPKRVLNSRPKKQHKPRYFEFTRSADGDWEVHHMAEERVGFDSTPSLNLLRPPTSFKPPQREGTLKMRTGTPIVQTTSGCPFKVAVGWLAHVASLEEMLGMMHESYASWRSKRQGGRRDKELPDLTRVAGGFNGWNDRHVDEIDPWGGYDEIDAAETAAAAGENCWRARLDPSSNTIVYLGGSKAP